MSDLINRLRDYATQRKGELADLVNEAADALEKIQLSGESTTSDLISRQAAIDAICTYGTELERRGVVVLAVANYKQVTVDLLEQLPSVQERKGRWLRYGEDGYPNEKDTVAWQCDQCLTTYYGRTERIANYCPNCGAHMEGAEDARRNE